MRVGLLTYHWVYNFGANLQALATTRLLDELGHHATVLNYRPPGLVSAYRESVSPDQAAVHEGFCEEHLPQSEVLPDGDAVRACCAEGDFDAILVGSDAVLRLSDKQNTEDVRFPNPFWLTWAHELDPRPRTACLAASCMGTNYLAMPAETRDRLRAALAEVDRITVRDRWTRRMVRSLLPGRPVELCPDPVAVLNEVADPPEMGDAAATAERQPYLLICTDPGQLPDATVRGLVDLAHSRQMQVIALPLPERAQELPVDRVLAPPMHPFEWYAWIRHAAGYVGKLFHAAACCTCNGVPFVSVDTYGRRVLRFFRSRSASKVWDLCRNFGDPKRAIPAPRLRKMSPGAIFRRLYRWDAAGVKAYARNAAGQFRQRIGDALGEKPASAASGREKEAG